MRRFKRIRDIPLLESFWLKPGTDTPLRQHFAATVYCTDSAEAPLLGAQRRGAEAERFRTTDVFMCE